MLGVRNWTQDAKPFVALLVIYELAPKRCACVSVVLVPQKKKPGSPLSVSVAQLPVWSKYAVCSAVESRDPSIAQQKANHEVCTRVGTTSCHRTFSNEPSNL
ncbi:hypothetical protein Plhal304r1_c083g0167701 [Plasmopara halstedii]